MFRARLLNNVKEKIAGKEDEVASAHQRLRETIVKDQLLELHFKTEYGTLRQVIKVHCAGKMVK